MNYVPEGSAPEETNPYPDAITPVYPLEAALTALVTPEAVIVGRALIAAGRAHITNRKLLRAIDALEKYLGGRPDKMFRNFSGDLVIIKRDRQIRFDINNHYPHKEPHFHVLKQRPNGKWRPAGREQRYPFKGEE
ncbi:MAG: hypothetical protein GC131_09075 [Alphaproteobacteria bacterium]|nr:hypothetical protein [Alphaproteobacteria bacterium]